ncbi:MAG: pseudouridine synthase [Bacteroidales bacterium]|nr:pseudouridine synthase [Bacteroidales bacterium]
MRDEKGNSGEKKFNPKKRYDKKKFFKRDDRKPFKKRYDSDERFSKDKPEYEKKSFGEERENSDNSFRRKFVPKKRYDDKNRRDDRKPFKKRYDSKERFSENKTGEEKKSFGEERESSDNSFRKKFVPKKRYDDKNRGDDRKKFFKRDDRKPFKKRYDSRERFSENKTGEEKKSFGEERESSDNSFRKKFDPERRFENKNRRDERKSFFERKDRQPFKKRYDSRDKFSGKNRDDDRKRFSDKKENDLVRLNKYIANAGICSRREADDLIIAGVIAVNDKTITELGFKISPNDVVKYNGVALKKERNVYVLLNKPKDYITTTDDPQQRNTVMELVRNACKERIYPVGRLDRNTTGLLLFTNDGDLAGKLAHPSGRVKKIYSIELDRALRPLDLEKIRNGIELEEGTIKVDEVYIQHEFGKNFVGLEIHIGWNRVVRRIFEELGYKIYKLDRIYYAGLTKKNLPRGKWRLLTNNEISFLKMGSK